MAYTAPEMSTDSSASPSPTSPPRADRAVVVDRTVAAALAWAALAVPLMVVGAVLGLLAPGLGWLIGVVVGALIGAVVVWHRLRSAQRRVLSLLGAEPASDNAHARLLNLAEGLSLAGGTGQPDLYVIDDPGLNAAALAGGGQAALVATTGLLGALDRVPLEGVVAEALVRVRNGDAEAATLGVSLFGSLLAGPLVLVTKPIGRLGIGRLLGPDRDLLADRAAVSLTRYPPGLLEALDQIRSANPVVGRRSPATDHLWLVPPSAIDGRAEVLPVAPLDLRIDVLGEL